MGNLFSDPEKKTFSAIGLMSGTSLDGLDIAMCEFVQGAEDSWSYSIAGAETISYSQVWQKKLKSSHLLSAEALVALDREYGYVMGEHTLRFIRKHGFKPDLIASHGHTVFHNPVKGYTLQIGSANTLASIVELPVVSDFRSLDVANGGQGAPLVPIGDKLLFGEYAACLNLGGFANISFEKAGNRLAFDICPFNIVLNLLAAKEGKKYDIGGELGSRGKIQADLLNKLNKLQFYSQIPPKSLGREWLESEFIPKVSQGSYSIIDLLRTAYEHFAQQIALVLNSNNIENLLVTGGGANNKFFIKQLELQTKTKITIPDNNLVDFKEALIFAFMGILRILKRPNCLGSVTGAKIDSVGGTLVEP